MTDTLAKLTEFSNLIRGTLAARSACIKEINERFDEKVKKLNEARTEACTSVEKDFIPRLEPLERQMKEMVDDLSVIEKVACCVDGEKFKVIPLSTKCGKKETRVYLLASDEKIGPGKAVLVAFNDYCSYPFCCSVKIIFQFKFGGGFDLLTPMSGCWLSDSYLSEQQKTQLTNELENVMFENRISTLLLCGDKSDTVLSYAKTVRFDIKFSRQSAHRSIKATSIQLLGEY